MASFSVRTGDRKSIIDITSQVRAIVRNSGTSEGICLVFVPHTTAAVLINENYDPAVRSDLIDHLIRLVPRDLSYAHSEGNSDAHIMASLIGSSASLPVIDGDLALGRWQGVMLCEFDGPRQRSVTVVITPTDTKKDG